MSSVNEPRLFRSSRGLLREDVYRYLRDEIVSGRYPPGQRLRDGDIADQLGVSRTPVREALRRLDDEGLVEAWANRWTRVASVDIDDAARAYPVVWALERLALTEAPSYSRERIAALEDANRRLSDAIGNKDPVSASQADRDFHQILVDAWENPEVARILNDLRTRLRRLEIYYFGGSLLADKSIGEHQAIIDALAKGNRTTAAKAIEANWRNSLRRLQLRTPGSRDAETPSGRPKGNTRASG